MDTKYLEGIRTELEEISGQWDGNESGILEDRAHAANEAIKYIDAIIPILRDELRGGFFENPELSK